MKRLLLVALIASMGITQSCQADASASEENKNEYEIYKRQYKSDGAMISFDIKGGEKEAFKFLNSLKLIKLAVSLGGTESLAEHPATMTHVDMSPEDEKMNDITEKLVRLSIGIENYEDLIWDINQALGKVEHIDDVQAAKEMGFLSDR